MGKPLMTLAMTSCIWYQKHRQQEGKSTSGTILNEEVSTQQRKPSTKCKGNLPTGREYFQTMLPDKGLISNICKDLLQPDSKKRQTNNLSPTATDIWKKGNANLKHIIMTHMLHMLQWLLLKKKALVGMLRNWNPCTPMMRMQTAAATLRTVWRVLKKLNTQLH